MEEAAFVFESFAVINNVSLTQLYEILNSLWGSLSKHINDNISSAVSTDVYRESHFVSDFFSLQPTKSEPNQTKDEQSLLYHIFLILSFTRNAKYGFILILSHKYNKYSMQSIRYIYILSILLILIIKAESINQKCQTGNSTLQEPCPKHSYCAENSFCVCDQSYVGNCSTKAISLSEESVKVKISKKMTFFQIKPQYDDFLVVYFTICHNSSSNYHQVMNLWYDDGYLDELKTAKALGNEKMASINQGCIELLSPFFKFDVQPNGEKEQLIYGLRLHEDGQIDVELKVVQKQFAGFDVFIKIVVILVVLLIFGCIGSLGFCFYRFRMRRLQISNANNQNNLDYFKQIMPIFKASDKNIAGDEICSICLGQINNEEHLRQTPCQHIFHAECLDSWCSKTLTCPVCRNGLDFQSIKNRKQFKQIQIAVKQSLENENQMIQTTKNRSNLRESMLQH